MGQLDCGKASVAGSARVPISNTWLIVRRPLRSNSHQIAIKHLIVLSYLERTLLLVLLVLQADCQFGRCFKATKVTGNFRVVVSSFVGCNHPPCVGSWWTRGLTRVSQEIAVAHFKAGPSAPRKRLLPRSIQSMPWHSDSSATIQILVPTPSISY
jgi:hypothetical protein